MKPIIRNLILLMLLSYSSNLMSQCLEITDSPDGGFGSIFNENCIKFLPSSNNIIYNQGDGTWEYLSPEIYIKPIDGSNGSFVAKSVSDASIGNFHLSSFRDDLTITPNGPNITVEKDHLFEISFTDNQEKLLDTRQKIATFLADPNGAYKPSYDPNSGYVNGFNNGIIVNPYDPDHISVDGIFWKPGTNSSPMIQYGFYYQKFYVGESNNWQQEYNAADWKIRFAPDEIGKWNYEVCVWVGNRLIAQSGLNSFTVTPTNDPGYVVVANGDNENKQYLKFSNSNETFFPVGNNYCWEWNDRSPAVLQHMEGAMDKIAGPNNSGANATRYMWGVGSYHIERNRLNNYNEYQPDMGAIDDYLTYLEGKNIYLTLGMITQDEFEVLPNDIVDPQNPTDPGDWKWNPYHYPPDPLDPNGKYKGISKLNDVPAVITADRFYTNPSARAFIKKRYRYINARWGYSTHLMIDELHSEISNSGLFSNGESIDVQRNKAVDWYNNMAGYMKETLKCKQLVSVSTGAESTDWQKKPFVLLDNLDVVLFHFYSARETAVKLAQVALYNTSFTLDSANKMKPILIQECGTIGNHLDEVTFCTDLEYHKRNWAYNFIGSSGVLYWDFAYLYPTTSICPWLYIPESVYHDYGSADNYFTHNINSKLYESEYYKNFPGIRLFFSNLDLKTKIYKRGHSYGPYLDGINSADPNQAKADPKWYETGYSVSSDKTVVFGWFRNRSSNYYNCDDCINTFYYGKYQYGGTSRIADNINNLWQDACQDIIDPKGDLDEWWCMNWPVTIYTWWPQSQVPQINCGFNINNPNDVMPTPTLNPGDDDYNLAFSEAGVYPDAMDVSNKYIGNRMVAKGIWPVTLIDPYTLADPVKLKDVQLKPNTSYNVQWYWTWNDKNSNINGNTAGSPYNGDEFVGSSLVNGIQTSDPSGNLTFNAPPTIWFGYYQIKTSSQGKAYPGDWAYIITQSNSGGSTKQIDKSVDIEDAFRITVVPNPTTGIVSINTYNLEIPYSMYLFDSQGLLIRTIVNINTNTFQIDMTNLPSGIYHLTLRNNSISKTIKIVKM
jgi:hypothetical protein